MTVNIQKYLSLCRILLLSAEFLLYIDMTGAAEGGIDMQHLRWLKLNYIIDCGFLKPNGAASARVINGVPTKQVYPWVVDISRMRKRKVPPKLNTVKRDTHILLV